MSRRIGIMRSVITTLAALALLIGVSPTIAAAQVTDDNVVQQLQDAKTPADHQALAEYFTAKAKEASVNAARHERMAGVTDATASREGMRKHCRNLVKTFRAQEADYEALAKEQAQLAKSGAH